MLTNGPVTQSRQERLQICHDIAARLHEVYGERLLAIGVYGSIARGTDGPFSDIEMLCVLSEKGEPVDFSYEWSAGPWKAEVNVLRADLLLDMAATVEGDWPLTHGPYFAQFRLYDPHSFFPRLLAAAESPTPQQFKAAIEAVLVGEMYEFIGKLRNADYRGPATYLPYLAMEFAQYGAMLVGLHHRTRFSTGAMVLPEASQLPDRPEGLDEVMRMVMSGELSEPAAIVSACERLWSGLLQWAGEHSYKIHSARIPF